MVGRGELEVRHERAAGGGRVGEAAGRADVVLEHLEAPVVAAHEVEPGDADPQVARRPDALHGRLEVLGTVDDARGHDALRDDPALAVDVGDERVERAHALGEPGLDARPLRGREDARYGVDDEHLVAVGGVEHDALVSAVALDFDRELLEIAAFERAHRAERDGADGAVVVDGLVVAIRRSRVVREQGKRVLGKGHTDRPSPIRGRLTYRHLSEVRAPTLAFMA